MNGRTGFTHQNSVRWITLEYDTFDRPKTEKWFSSSGSLQRTITSVYDTYGRLTSVSDPSGTLAYAYDAYDRTSKTTVSLAGLTPQVILDSTFDPGSSPLVQS